MIEIPDVDDEMLKDAIPETVSFNTRDPAFVLGHEFVFGESGRQHRMKVTSVTRTETDWTVRAVVAHYKG